jgi:hypothetical protein
MSDIDKNSIERHLHYGVTYLLPDGTKIYFTDKMVFMGSDDTLMQMPTPSYQEELERKYNLEERAELDDEDVLNPQSDLGKPTTDFYKEDVPANPKPPKRPSNPRKKGLETKTTDVLKVMLKQAEEDQDFDTCLKINDEITRRVIKAKNIRDGFDTDD